MTDSTLKSAWAAAVASQERPRRPALPLEDEDNQGTEQDGSLYLCSSAVYVSLSVYTIDRRRYSGPTSVRVSHLKVPKINFKFNIASQNSLLFVLYSIFFNISWFYERMYWELKQKLYEITHNKTRKIIFIINPHYKKQKHYQLHNEIGWGGKLDVTSLELNRAKIHLTNLAQEVL